MPSLVSLAEDLLRAAKVLESHLADSSLPHPDWDNDLLTSLPPELQTQRNALINGADDLKQLAQGPHGISQEIGLSWTSQVALRVAYAYKLPSHVPLEGSCSYASIADTTGLPESIVRRILRHCMCNHIFAQTPKGEVRHTAASRLIAVDSDSNDAIGMELDEWWPASTYLLDALRKFGDDGEQNETAFALAEQARNALDGAERNGNIKEDVPLRSTYDIFAQHPKRGRRFGAGMRYFTKDAQFDLRHLLSGFDWSGVDAPGAIVVDVGGGIGSVSHFLARNTKHLHFVIQDLQSTVENGRKQLPVELHDRVEFAAHDFFTPQKKAANIFLMRWIIHNWTDRKAVALLKNLASGMSEGSQLVIFDWLMYDEPQTQHTEKILS